MTANSIVTQISNALLSLSSVCDGAMKHDDCGFNGRDAAFGRVMAQRVINQEPLTPKMLRACGRMLQTYRNTQLRGMELPTFADVQAYLDASVTPAPRAPRTPASAPQQSGALTLAGNQILITFPYNAVLVKQVRQLYHTYRGMGYGVYNGQKGWEILASAEAFTAAVSAFPTFTISDALQQRYHDRAEEAAARSAEQLAAQQLHDAETAQILAAAGDLAAPLPNGDILYAHQRVAVEFLIRQRRAILADDMGLGKTLSALVAAKAFGLRVLVVCPVSLRDNWLKEAAKIQLPIEVYSWAKQPAPLEQSYVVIADEAHAIQTAGRYVIDPKTGKEVVRGVKRTADLLRLTLHKHCAAFFALTGTPIRNGRPANIFPLLQAIRHPLGENRRAFEKRYCNGGPTEFSAWDATGAAHLDELHQNIKSSMLHRVKSQCLDLPAFTRIPRPVELSARAQKQYNAAVAAMRTDYLRRVAEGVISNEGEALVMLTQLRRAGSIAKTETAIEMVDDLLAAGQQVVVFSAFKESLMILADHCAERRISCVSLTGDTAQNDRDMLVQQFQQRQAQVFLATFGAGGVGITLTAAQDVILMDRPWTPADAQQAEGRIDRIGQKNMTTSYWLQDQMIDPKIDSILAAKQKRIEQVMHGQRKTMRGTGDIRQVARELLAYAFTGADADLEDADF